MSHETCKCKACTNRQTPDEATKAEVALDELMSNKYFVINGEMLWDFKAMTQSEVIELIKNNEPLWTDVMLILREIQPKNDSEKLFQTAIMSQVKDWIKKGV